MQVVGQSGTAGATGRGHGASTTEGDVIDLRERLAPYGATAIPHGLPIGPTLTSHLASAAGTPIITLVDAVAVTRVPRRREGRVVWEPVGR